MKYCPMANKDNLIKTGHFKCLESISQKLRGKASHLFGYYDLLHTYLIFCFSQSVNASKFAHPKNIFPTFPSNKSLHFFIQTFSSLHLLICHLLLRAIYFCSVSFLPLSYPFNIVCSELYKWQISGSLFKFNLVYILPLTIACPSWKWHCFMHPHISSIFKTLFKIKMTLYLF